MFEECRLVSKKFTLSSGRESCVFYDFDLLSPREAAEYVDQLLKQMEPVFNWDEVDFIATPALGGVIPAFLVAFAKDKPLVIVDKGDNLRGPEFKSGNYLVVDDVISSFNACNLVVSVLPGANCLGVAAYIFRGSWDDLNQQKYTAYYLARKEQEVVKEPDSSGGV
jgi:orotate phosphoribosyltransferase